MYFKVNLKLKKPTFCCCFTWVVIVKLTDTTLWEYLVMGRLMLLYSHYVFDPHETHCVCTPSRKFRLCIRPCFHFEFRIANRLEKEF